MPFGRLWNGMNSIKSGDMMTEDFARLFPGVDRPRYAEASSRDMVRPWVIVATSRDNLAGGSSGSLPGGS